MVQLTSEQLGNRQQATSAYLNDPGSPDLLPAARAYALSLGIDQNDTGGMASAMSNFAVGHYITKGKNENRGGTAGLETTGTEVNTNLAIVPRLSFTTSAPNAEGETSTFYNPVEVTFDPTNTPNFTSTDGGDDAGGGDSGPGDGSSGGSGGGGDTDSNAGGGIMSGPVDLAPVTNLIGTPGAGQTGPQATLMGQTAGLATGQQGIRDVVNPLGEQVTALQSAVTPLAGNVGEIKTGVTNLGTNVGTAADKSGLYAPISNLQTGVTGISSAIGTQAEGQPNLLTGQKDLTRDVGNVQQGVTNLTTNIGAPAAEGGPQTLFAGQADISKAIGTPADGQTLFGGQQGLMSGQTGLTTDIRKVGSDLTTTGTNLQKAIQDFQAASQEYQAGATAKRGDIANTAIANQNTLMGSLGDVGLNTNRAAEMLTKQRQDEAAQYKTAQAPLQQQIANLTASNNAQGNANQQIGALGPMAADPRDALIQQLLTRNASLMNNRPV